MISFRWFTFVTNMVAQLVAHCVLILVFLGSLRWSQRSAWYFNWKCDIYSRFFPGVVDEIIQNAILGYNYMNSNLWATLVLHTLQTAVIQCVIHQSAASASPSIWPNCNLDNIQNEAIIVQGINDPIAKLLPQSCQGLAIRNVSEQDRCITTVK